MDLSHILFSFKGRIRRTHYWLGAIGSGIVFGVILMVIMLVFGGGAALMAQGGTDGANAGAAGIGIIGVLAYIAVMVFVVWISLALQVKRWHDRDKSGVWVFINFIPLIGGLWALVECGFLDGTMGPNQFGPSPKGITGPPVTAPPVTPVVS